MNLLVALTVSATEELREVGEIIQAEKRIKDIVKDAEIIKSSGFLHSLSNKLPWTSSKLIMDRLDKSTFKKVCVKYVETKKSQPFWRNLKEFWKGGLYPIHAYTYKIDKKSIKFNVNVPYHLIKKARLALEKKEKRRQEFEAKIQALKLNKSGTELSRFVIHH